MDFVLRIEPLGAPARATLSVPGSKSITNRALLLAALAPGRSTITHALESDDTRVFAGSLARLGVAIEYDAGSFCFRLTGTASGPQVEAADLFVGNAGTAARFITAFAALGGGRYGFDGVGAMRRRPVADLLEVLQDQGATVRYGGEAGFMPFVLEAAGLRGGKMLLNAEKSSQQISALLLVAPYARSDTRLTMTGEIVSEPYIEMTCEMMRMWGARVERSSPREIDVAAGARYAPRTYAVEPDASSASYFFAAAAATGGRVGVRGLSLDSLQGDARFVRVLERMGCRIEQDGDVLVVDGPSQLRGVTVDMNEISDTAPTLAAIASRADAPVRITNVEHMRWKETDRIEAMAAELRAMGAALEVHQDGLTIEPRRLHSAVVKTYDDHRMAMSLAVAGLTNDGVVLEDPGCVSKTFGTFYDVLEALRRESLAAHAG